MKFVVVPSQIIIIEAPDVPTARKAASKFLGKEIEWDIDEFPSYFLSNTNLKPDYILDSSGEVIGEG